MHRPVFGGIRRLQRAGHPHLVRGDILLKRAVHPGSQGHPLFAEPDKLDAAADQVPGELEGGPLQLQQGRHMLVRVNFHQPVHLVGVSPHVDGFGQGGQEAVSRKAQFLNRAAAHLAARGHAVKEQLELEDLRSPAGVLDKGGVGGDSLGLGIAHLPALGVALRIVKHLDGLFFPVDLRGNRHFFQRHQDIGIRHAEIHGHPSSLPTSAFSSGYRPSLRRSRRMRSSIMR